MDLVGITAADLGEQPDTEVWAENWPATQVFISMRTQWNVGMAGPTGLKYETIPVVIDLMGLDVDRPDLFHRLKILEGESLRVMSENRKK